MRITVVTIYRDQSCEHYLGAVQGSLGEEQKQALAAAYGCQRVNTDAELLDGVDQIFFCELDVCETAAGLSQVMNIDGEHYNACQEGK
jgi:hypothetical protein